jgi:hypothetical protein
LLDTKVKMIMVSAAGIKPFVTSRAREFALHVLVNRQLRTAGTAKYCSLMKVVLGPNLDWMIGDSVVAILAGVVHAAALHLNRDDVCGPVIMLAACLRVEIDATNLGKIRNDNSPCGQVTLPSQRLARDLIVK